MRIYAYAEFSFRICENLVSDGGAAYVGVRNITYALGLLTELTSSFTFCAFGIVIYNDEV